MLPSTSCDAALHCRPTTLLALPPRHGFSSSSSNLPCLHLNANCGQRRTGVLVFAVQKSPKGFGKAPEKKKQPQPQTQRQPQPGSGKSLKQAKDESEAEAEADDDDVVPEVVTNRMLKRITFTVGIPFAVGVAFFVLYYYLKAVRKVDVPEWLPLFTSLLTFGSAGAGITYGVLSASWDPAREGSALGWKEAQLNWPVFLQTLRGKGDKQSQD